MTTWHIIRSILEVITILLVSYGVYRQDALDRFICRIWDQYCARNNGQTCKQPEKPVVFTGIDIFWIEKDDDGETEVIT